LLDRNETSANNLPAEPGLSLVKPDGMLYRRRSRPCPLPYLRFFQIAQAIDFALSKVYPARGEV